MQVSVEHKYIEQFSVQMVPMDLMYAELIMVPTESLNETQQKLVRAKWLFL
jgi:hypothetical protein